MCCLLLIAADVSEVSPFGIWCLILFRLPGFCLDILHAKSGHGTRITPVSIRKQPVVFQYLGLCVTKVSGSMSFFDVKWSVLNYKFEACGPILHLRCWLEVLQACKNLCQQLRSHWETIGWYGYIYWPIYILSNVNEIWLVYLMQWFVYSQTCESTITLLPWTYKRFTARFYVIPRLAMFDDRTVYNLLTSSKFRYIPYTFHILYRIFK